MSIEMIRMVMGGIERASLSQQQRMRQVADHFESKAKKYCMLLNSINETIYELSAELSDDPDRHRPSELRMSLVNLIDRFEGMQLDTEMVIHEMEGE